MELMFNAAKKTLLLCLLISSIFVNVASSDELSDSNHIFAWAELNYPQYFSVLSSGTNETVTSDGYIFRYYDKTDTYIITYNKILYLYGDLFGGLLEVDSVNSFLALIDCNEFELDAPEAYDAVSVGESVNSVHHKNIAGYTITGHNYVTDQSGEAVKRKFSVYFRCDRTHKTTIDGVGAIEGSFVADYNSSEQPVIFLYNSAGGEKHTLSIVNMSVNLAESMFDSEGALESITKTYDCGDEEIVTATDEISCKPSEYTGYMFCQYTINLTNNPDLGRWQQESFFHYMKNAGELTEEINRYGAHVDLTDGAEELKVFQRGDDVSLGATDINNESTLKVEKDGEDSHELEYHIDAPDDEARDMVMTYLPADEDGSENFRVHLKSGKGIAPSESYILICHEPRNCCYGNHCLDQYDSSGNDRGQYLGTRVYFGFYAPMAGATCRVEPEEQNGIMTTIGVEFDDPVTDDNPDDDDPDGDDDPEKISWSFSVGYSSYYGSGSMQIDNFTVDTNCNQEADSFCVFVSNDYASTDISISYSADLLYDSDLAPLLVYMEDGKITMDWSAIVSPSWGEGFSAQIGGSPYGDYMAGFCSGDMPAGAVEKFRNGEEFSWTSTTEQGSEETTCSYSFKPHKSE